LTVVSGHCKPAETAKPLNPTMAFAESSAFRHFRDNKTPAAP
jgi:hypothetical protein